MNAIHISYGEKYPAIFTEDGVEFLKRAVQYDYELGGELLTSDNSEAMTAVRKVLSDYAELVQALETSGKTIKFRGHEYKIVCLDKLAGTILRSKNEKILIRRFGKWLARKINGTQG